MKAPIHYTLLRLIGLFIVLLFCNSEILIAKNTIEKLTNSNGLSNNAVNCITEDLSDQLWIGTWDGLSMYNGRDFMNFRNDRTNSNSISNNIIREIITSDSSHIWISTDYGINRMNLQSQTFERFFPGQKGFYPKQEKSYLISKCLDGQILCYVKQNGLYAFDENTQDFYLIKKNSQNIIKMVTDEQNNLYLLDENGSLKLYEVKKHGEKIILEDNSLSQKQEKGINDIFYSNNFFIIVYQSYIKVINTKNTYPSTIDINPNKKISDIIFCNNKLFISYYLGGVDIYNFSTKKFESMNGLSMAIFTLYWGNQDILWVGTDGQGLLQIINKESGFNSIYTNFPVRAFADYGSDGILIGSKGGGIQFFDKKNEKLSTLFTNHNGLIDNSVYAITQNKEGDYFVGTEGQGINIISKNNNISKLKIPKDTIYFGAIYSMLFTNNDSILWVGTSGYGLLKIKLHKVGNNYIASDIQQYNSQKETSLSNDIIYTISQDLYSDKLWVGTRGGGLYSFDTKALTFSKITNLNSNDILSIVRSNEYLWIGTAYGLDQAKTSRSELNVIKDYSTQDGLLNNTIHGIIPDQENLWISTNQGISRLNLNDQSVVNYTEKDGLQNNEFADGAYYKDKNNILFFGGVSGFNYFNPQTIYFREFSPKITLTSFKIYNNLIDINKRIRNNELTLKYDEAFTTLSFIANDFIGNKNCEYKYRLLNFSNEWINNGTNPNIVLTKLPFGRYTLEVMATNGDRIWGDFVYNLEIIVLPPWWLSQMAFLTYVIIISCILYIIYSVVRNRIKLNRQLLLEHIEKKHQQKIHESKLNFFTNVAHEFFTPLSLIYGPAQYLLEKNLASETKRYIKIIKNNADRMQKLISELMEFRKVESGHTPLYPEKIDLNLLINYIIDNYEEIKNDNKINLSSTFENLEFFNTDRNSLEKILFNLISNAFKYTPIFGYIQLSVSQNQQHLLHIKIKNSGQGLTDEQMNKIFNQFKIFENTNLENTQSTGIGLSLTKSLVELLGGSIKVTSQLNSYVCFEIEIPEMQNSPEQFAIEDNSMLIKNDISLDTDKNVLIMIIDDQKNIRNLVADILSPYYTTIQAENGEKALNLLTKNTPDIIISDILMPLMNGLSFTDELKKDPLYAHIPVIAISAKISVNDHIEALQHGVDLYINKPFHPKQILVAIKNILSKQKQLKNYYNSELSLYTYKDGITIHNDDNIFVQKLTALIEKNIDDEHFNANSIVEYIDISKATLFRKLKEIKDVTPSEFIRTIRLRHAAKLLTSSKMTVRQIMIRIGFTNKSYFYREFNKRFNMSPLEYRNKNSLTNRDL